MDEYNMNTCITHTPADTITEEEGQYRELDQWLAQWLYAPRRCGAESRTWTIYWEKVDEE